MRVRAGRGEAAQERNKLEAAALSLVFLPACSFCPMTHRAVAPGWLESAVSRQAASSHLQETPQRE
eukprot:1852494-Pleurochrysis_carterae.AAC.1